MTTSLTNSNYNRYTLYSEIKFLFSGFALGNMGSLSWEENFMEHGSSLLSLMFSLSFCIYIFWGIYVIKVNPKGNVNRIFLAVSISLGMWSFGYSMISLSTDIETALFWKRFSAVGNMFLFSTVLHFVLLLANKDASVKQIKLFWLIHIPAFINVYIFSFSSTMASIQYNMMKIDYGWIDIPVNNVWSFQYYFYSVLYMSSCIIIIGKWKKYFKNEEVSKQANLFLLTFIGALIMAIFTNSVVSSMFENPLPQVTPLFGLVPVWAMYHSVRYYNVLNVKKIKKEEMIVNEDQQKRIFINLSFAICIGAILSFTFEYGIGYLVSSSDLKSAAFKSCLLILLGLSLFFIQRIRKNSLKDVLTTIVLVVSIPAVLFRFLEFSILTVWVFPIVIMVSSLLFSKRILLISVTVVAIITQRVAWILRPESYVLLNKYDYIFRILVFIVVFLIGSYINKIYLNKIKENNSQIEFQKIVADVSLDFVSLNQENFDEKINDLLGTIGHFFNVDRTYLFTINNSKGTMTYSNEWCSTGINGEVGTIEEISLDTFSWWIDQLDKKNLVYIKDVDSMPEEASAEKEQLQRQGVKSLVAVPVMEEERMKGFIGFESVLANRNWSEEKIEALHIIANIISSGLMQIKADKEIQFMAYYDNLTKLPNRFLFADRVKKAIELSKRTGKLTSVIFIDLDNFKSVNDTIGHKGGDVLLKQVAKSLVGVLRKSDTVARFGGDEFMIMINNINDCSMISNITDKIMGMFSETFVVNDQEFLITASAGIAICPIDGEDSETLVKNADIAMYEAKAKGKNQYALCTKDMKAEIQMSIDLSNDLYRALDRNELIVYYQPQVDLITKKITGMEALVRWMHPTRGMMFPGVFIPIAEKNGLINRIGEWVFKTACAQNKNWQDKGLPNMDIAINLSAIQIINSKLPDNLERIIKETGLDPKYIELEITESVAIKEINYVVEVLNKLKKIGVSIAIDDFGTEYSSLSRLKLLPIDRIKIDMQFIQGLENNDKDKAITMIIINLAKSLGLNVIAEGVETEPQLAFLNQKMCDNVQGYFYYKPMPASEMEKILIDLSKE